MGGQLRGPRVAAVATPVRLSYVHGRGDSSFGRDGGVGRGGRGLSVTLGGWIP